MVINPSDATLQRIQEAHQMLVKLVSRPKESGENLSDCATLPHESDTNSESTGAFDVNAQA